MSDKKLGKISSARFGIGGYQDAMIGLHLQFRMGPSGIGMDKCAWDPALIECRESAEWTEEDRDRHFSEIVRFVSKLLSEAKVKSVPELVGVPVEVEMTEEGCGSFIDFRVLTEVL